MNKSPRQRCAQRQIESENLPGMEFQDLVEAQRRNIDAITKAQLIAIQGAHAIARRQADIIRETFDGVAGLATETMAPGDHQNATLMDPTAMQAGFERTLEHMKDLMGVMMETNMSVFDVMNLRFADMFDQDNPSEK